MKISEQIGRDRDEAVKTMRECALIQKKKETEDEPANR